MLTVLITIVHVIACLFLIVVVLLQSGKAADLAGAFGGMGSQTAFGPRGAATALTRATTIAAGLFMITSLSLGVLATRNAGSGSSVLERTNAPKPVAPKPQPTMELSTEGGEKKSIPIQLPPPGQTQPQPIQPAAPQGQTPPQAAPAAPAKK